jgi:hypothetical protein
MSVLPRTSDSTVGTRTKPMDDNFSDGAPRQEVDASDNNIASLSLPVERASSQPTSTVLVPTRTPRTQFK